MGTQIHLTGGMVVSAWPQALLLHLGWLDMDWQLCLCPHLGLLEAPFWIDARTHTPLLPGLLKGARVPMESWKTAPTPGPAPAQSCT